MIISNIPTGILFDECSTFTTFSAAATMDRKYHRSGKKNSFMTYQVVPSHMFLTQFCIFMSNTSTKGWWSHPHFHRSSCITPDRLQDWKAPDKYTHSKYETHKETSLVGQKQKQEKTSKTSTSCKDECIRVKCIVGDKNYGFATARQTDRRVCFHHHARPGQSSATGEPVGLGCVFAAHPCSVL